MGGLKGKVGKLRHSLPRGLGRGELTSGNSEERRERGKKASQLPEERKPIPGREEKRRLRLQVHLVWERGKRGGEKRRDS